MKVLFVASDEIPHIGGKSTHITDLIKGLRELGHETHLISFSNISKRYKIFVKLLLVIIRLVDRSLYSYLYKKLMNHRFSKIILNYSKFQNIDVISAQDAIIAIACKKTNLKLKIPIILTMHTYFAIENTLDNSNVNINGYGQRKILKYELKAISICRNIISVDSRINKHINSYIEEMQIKLSLVTISNFTDLSRFYPVSSEEKYKLRSKYKINKDDFIVICSRRLVEKNGVIYAVKAFNNIPSDLNIKLLIAGDGPCRNEIEDFIAKNLLESRISLLGNILNAELTDYYQLADASIIPSITVNGLQEATSISALESMACGLPTIATDIGGLKELVHNDKTGFLISERDPIKLSEVLLLLKSDRNLRLKIGSDASKYIIENHSHISAAKRYADIFR